MKLKKGIMSAVGVLIVGISVGFFKMASFGVDPFQSLVSGANQLIPIHYGTMSLLFSALLLIFTILFDRHYIGITTFASVFLLGYVAEFTHKLLLAAFPDASMAIRVVIFLIGFTVVCFGSSIYIIADLGVSSYDSVALIIVNKWKIGQFKYVRICTDLTCVVGGCILFLLGGGTLQNVTSIIGVGTIATAFCMGPLIDLFNRTVAIPMLYGSHGKEDCVSPSAE